MGRPGRLLLALAALVLLSQEIAHCAFSVPSLRSHATKTAQRWGLGAESKRPGATRGAAASSVSPEAAIDMPPLWTVALQGLALLGASTGAIAATLGKAAAVRGIVGIAGMYVIMSVNEYVVHRYYQHLWWNRTALNKWLRSTFGFKNMKTSGHMEHHAETLDDMSLDMVPEPILDADPFRGTAFSWSVSAKMTLEIALQSYPWLWLCGWSWTASTAALASSMLLHAAVWQTLHPAMHGLPDPGLSYGVPGWSMAWLRKTSYFKFLYGNHEGHHRTPGAHGNYNVCFPLADHIFGTYKGYVPAGVAENA